MSQIYSKKLAKWAKYYIYRNLHTGTFSLKFKGKVIKHPKECTLRDVTFKVSAKGQARVRKEKRKNVHATVVGKQYYDLVGDFNIKDYDEIYYNPYKTDTFIDHNGNPIYQADEAICINNKIYVRK